LMDVDTWPKCGWTNEVGWQGCKRDAQVAQFDDDGEVIFRCVPHVEETERWAMVTVEEFAA
jgi:hypothetical protein